MTTSALGAAATPSSLVFRIVAGFVGGFVATLVFHQGMVEIFYLLGVTPNPPFNMRATQPLGVPQVFSLAFWGGVWGIIFMFAQSAFPRGAGYWIAAAIFGAVFPSLAIWTVVQPLRGAGFWVGVTGQRMMIAGTLNAAWGLGTALIYRYALSWNAARNGG